MNVLVLYLAITVIGYFIGAFLTKKGIMLKGMSVMQTVAIIVLVFLMGSQIGADRSIVKSLDSIGLAAFVMTLFILAGSLLAVFLARKLLGFDKKGNLVKFTETADMPQARHEDSSQEIFASVQSESCTQTPPDGKFVKAPMDENQIKVLSESVLKASNENLASMESAEGLCCAGDRVSSAVGASGESKSYCTGMPLYDGDGAMLDAGAGDMGKPSCNCMAADADTASTESPFADSDDMGFNAASADSDAVVDAGGSSAGKSAGIESGDGDRAGVDHTMTICITASVVAGILAGYFIIPEGFTAISGNLIVAGLSLLLLFVGMDIGVEGTIVTNFKRAGWRVIVFPFMIMVGTYIGAAAASLVLPVTVQDALCVGSGFGWYTLAPAMLAEYSMELSAMSFMHNVMRELIGILIMPIVAAKVGYIETISLPGSSSMDVCLPIVERVTRSDIAVYSFLSGAVLSASTPILVSFMMGL